MIRALLILTLFASPVSAATYSLTDDQGRVNCIEYDGSGRYVPPAGSVLSSQSAPNCSATPVYATPSTILTANAFRQRFTDAELAASWAAASRDATGAIGAGLTKGLTADQVDLTDPSLAAWMGLLVQAGAVTSDRAAQILAP